MSTDIRPAHNPEVDVIVEAKPIASTALEASTRAEIDIQIATAKRYPRSAEAAIRDAKTMATLSPKIAASCSYALKRAGKTIEGPSIRLAEIMVTCWGNLRVASRIVGQDDRFVTAQATCLDLEKNTGVSIEVKRRITDAQGRRYNDDMIGTTSSAAVSIAFRNAVLRVVPRVFVEYVEQEARALVRGEIRSIPEEYASWVAYWSERGVSEDRVLLALDVRGPADVTIDHLMTLNGLRQAIDDGEATIREIFDPKPETVARRPGESQADALTRALTGGEEASGGGKGPTT